MCVGCWAWVTYLRYTVLDERQEAETAVHCCDLAFIGSCHVGVSERFSPSHHQPCSLLFVTELDWNDTSVEWRLKQRNRGFARQPCCMAGTKDSFSHGKRSSFICKIFHCSCHATWLPCETSIPMKKRLATPIHALVSVVS